MPKKKNSVSTVEKIEVTPEVKPEVAPEIKKPVREHIQVLPKQIIKKTCPVCKARFSAQSDEETLCVHCKKL